MSKTLAELRTSPDTALPERAYQLCLSQKTVAKVLSLENEQADLEVEAERNRDADGERKSSARAADGPDPRLAEIETELGDLYDVMREHTGELILRGVDQGAWARWTDEHPAREDNKRDEDTCYGYCNTDDLIAALGTYAASWNGEALAGDDWTFIASKAAPGDIKQIAREVVQMHEVTGAVPKSRSASSGNQQSESA